MRYLSESVGKGFHHDAVVIIALLHKFLAELFGTKHTDCKQPDIVLHSAFQRSNKIRQTEVRVRTCGVFLCLLKMRKKNKHTTFKYSSKAVPVIQLYSVVKKYLVSSGFVYILLLDLR